MKDTKQEAALSALHHCARKTNYGEMVRRGMSEEVRRYRDEHIRPKRDQHDREDEEHEDS